MGDFRVPNPVGTDEQYDLLFRSYLNSAERTRKLATDIDSLVRAARQSSERIGLLGGTKSRLPGGSLFHLIFRRLVRRQLNPTIEALVETNNALIATLERITEVWDSVYRHEFEMERRSRDGILDRLAVVDALQIRFELLEQDLQTRHVHE